MANQKAAARRWSPKLEVIFFFRHIVQQDFVEFLSGFLGCCVSNVKINKAGMIGGVNGWMK